MKRLINIIMGVAAVTFVAIMFTSCMDSKEARRLFADVEAIIEDHPDSALALLDSAYEASQDYPKSQRMRYNLLLTEAKNKAYVAIDNDSVMQEVVQYYDSHGTANERVHAHYLLGCSYRDMGESPQALNSFYDAIATSDTLSADCDWDLMMRVWGQIADVLNDQYMPMEYLEANQQYTKCAEKAHDEYEKIRGIELQVKAYYMLADTDKVITTIDSAYNLYEQRGMHAEAVKTLPLKIYCLIAQHKLKEAESLISLFEKDSELLNANGIIEEEGRTGFHLIKADYYLKKGEYVAAITECHKNGIYNSDICKDLMQAYKSLGNSDSVLYYAELYSLEKNKELKKIYYDSNKKVLALYNYNRQTRIAQEKEKEAEKSKILMLIGSVVIIFTAIIMYTLYYLHERQREYAFTLLNNAYLNKKREYDEINQAMAHIDYEHKEYTKKAKQYIYKLKEDLLKYEQQYQSLSKRDKAEAIKQSNVFHKFIQTLKPRPNNDGIKMSDWEELYSLVAQCMPFFHSRVIEHGELSTQEKQVAILTILGFTTTDISILLEKAKQSINNSKTKTNKKLFNQNGAKNLLQNLQSLNT